jgi:hypothetical protein
MSDKENKPGSLPTVKTKEEILRKYSSNYLFEGKDAAISAENALLAMEEYASQPIGKQEKTVKEACDETLSKFATGKRMEHTGEQEKEVQHQILISYNGADEWVNCTKEMYCRHPIAKHKRIISKASPIEHKGVEAVGKRLARFIMDNAVRPIDERKECYGGIKGNEYCLRVVNTISDGDYLEYLVVQLRPLGRDGETVFYRISLLYNDEIKPCDYNGNQLTQKP